MPNKKKPATKKAKPKKTTTKKLHEKLTAFERQMKKLGL